MSHKADSVNRPAYSYDHGPVLRTAIQRDERWRLMLKKRSLGVLTVRRIAEHFGGQFDAVLQATDGDLLCVTKVGRARVRLIREATSQDH